MAGSLENRPQIFPLCCWISIDTPLPLVILKLIAPLTIHTYRQQCYVLGDGLLWKCFDLIWIVIFQQFSSKNVNPWSPWSQKILYHHWHVCCYVCPLSATPALGDIMIVPYFHSVCWLADPLVHFTLHLALHNIHEYIIHVWHVPDCSHGLMDPTMDMNPIMILVNI